MQKKVAQKNQKNANVCKFFSSFFKIGHKIHNINIYESIKNFVKVHNGIETYVT